jgi:hypothetical protein
MFEAIAVEAEGLAYFNFLFAKRPLADRMPLQERSGDSGA